MLGLKNKANLTNVCTSSAARMESVCFFEVKTASDTEVQYQQNVTYLRNLLWIHWSSTQGPRLEVEQMDSYFRFPADDVTATLVFLQQHTSYHHEN
jgi:hypothetical protein